MINFKHIDASSTEHALSLLAQYGERARLLAGGQDLLFRIKKHIVKPECVVNIKTIPGLSYVRSEPQENLRIGALTTLSQIAASLELQQRYSVLAQAAGVVASPQIRNLGTLAGNVCQDVWCWYLQDGFSCWKSGGKFCDLAGGDSRYYGSIMGGHLCLSNHPSDTAVALAALDAQVHVVSPRGKRTTAISDFLPGHTWVDGRLQSHALRAAEIVTEIEIPFRPTHSAYVKFTLRKSWDFAIASAAVSAVIQDGIWNDVRIVLGGVATSPYRSREAEDLLRSKQISKAGAAEASEVALQLAKPLKMNGYKVELSKTLVRRALLSLAS
ncbi:MAG TPA: xanthine dehydrogenase family protein subunit M [Candidatus Binatia bacterium]|nr:xanthine dehydrogenase family protein subunit M [Candidatus Binatia bacterium]